MALQQWSQGILVADLSDEPQLSEDLLALREAVDARPVSVVVNMAAMRQIASSNLASLLHLRQKLIQSGKLLRLCCVPRAVQNVMQVTRLDKVFAFTPDVPSALASIQLEV